MKTYSTFAVASLVLVAATGAMAAPPNAEGEIESAAINTRAPTTETIVADLLASRQAAPTLPPRDGEWYNVPAPLGGMAEKVRYENAGSPQAMPAEQTDWTSRSH